ncbi:hypothetical protein [Helicobacter mesocricetorum]|uniref:hypothetical protein n=1 Tax=Helicobacter mesocricetorum TaxID=87012 RepID=UPI000CF15C3D|nr:hypothetical protein [Helicobacter mesocricetorum]
MFFTLLNKTDIKAILAVVCMCLSLILCLLLWQNSYLKENLFLKDLEIQQANSNLKELNLALEKQNESFKKIQVQKTSIDATTIKQIVLKDSSCQAEIRAYKQIFKELGK